MKVSEEDCTIVIPACNEAGRIEGACVPVRQSKGRQVQSRLFILFVRIVFSLPYCDTPCGAKEFRTQAVQVVLPSVRSHGFEFDVEPPVEDEAAGICRMGSAHPLAGPAEFTSRQHDLLWYAERAF